MVACPHRPFVERPVLADLALKSLERLFDSLTVTDHYLATHTQASYTADAMPVERDSVMEQGEVTRNSFGDQGPYHN